MLLPPSFIGGVTSVRSLVGSLPSLNSPHVIPPSLPRVLKHVIQVACASEHFKTIDVPKIIPSVCSNVSWIDEQCVAEWGLFPSGLPF